MYKTPSALRFVQDASWLSGGKSKPNIKAFVRVFMSEDGVPTPYILFEAMRLIKAGEEITMDCESHLRPTRACFEGEVALGITNAVAQGRVPWLVVIDSSSCPQGAMSAGSRCRSCRCAEYHAWMQHPNCCWSDEAQALSAPAVPKILPPPLPQIMGQATAMWRQYAMLAKLRAQCREMGLSQEAIDTVSLLPCWLLILNHHYLGCAKAVEVVKALWLAHSPHHTYINVPTYRCRLKTT